MRFDDLKKMLRCMSAFHQNPEVSEEQRYAKALEQMLFVISAKIKLSQLREK